MPRRKKVKTTDRATDGQGVTSIKHPAKRKNIPPAGLESHSAVIEELVDKPEIVKGPVRVAGPFTMEGVIAVEEGPIQQKDGEYVVEVEGMDVYDPVRNTLFPTDKQQIAAWFLDTDYDEG